MTGPLLQTGNLSRNFGGLSAVDNVSIDFVAGQVHAIIGPNGAGKTTLINLLSGELKPSSGNISFKGQDISAATGTLTILCRHACLRVNRGWCRPCGLCARPADTTKTVFAPNGR